MGSHLQLTAMPARVLNGIEIANQIKAEVADEVARLAGQGIRPGLAAVLVGDDAASEIYVRSKVKTCESLGLHAQTVMRPAATTTEELLQLIGELNRRDDVDGILVQLPLPRHIEPRTVLQVILPEKDVDGLHPINAGRLAMKLEGLLPCTPAGVMEILRRSEIAIAGAEAVVVGRSNIVGKPMAMLLTNGDATVTLCHSKTRELAAVTRRAEILVVATGRPGLITQAHVKPGATVVDIGMNRIETRAEFERLFKGDKKREAAFAKNGYVLAGDVRPEVAEIAGAITPVPGGVGPLTIAMLMVNTVKAAKMRRMQAGVPAFSAERG